MYMSVLNFLKFPQLTSENRTEVGGPSWDCSNVYLSQEETRDFESKLGFYSHHSEAEDILLASDYRACGHNSDINIDFFEEHTQGKTLPESKRI